MSDPRPYATLLAKGEDRRQQILLVAQRLLTRFGWRQTTIAQIAAEAGVTPAGVLHHFQSKEQLLHAVVDARDANDDEHADRNGDLFTEIRKVADRMNRAPELVGSFTVLLVENALPEAPLHDRIFDRWRAAVDIVADRIRRDQESGRFRSDFDPTVRAMHIVAFITGMEISWLLDRSIPLTEVFNEYTTALERDFIPDAK